MVIANTKLYINAAEGFIGTSLKKNDFLCECSDLDDIICFTKAGIMKVVRVSDKVFIGKDILHAAVFQKGDERTTYNMIYVDGASGVSYAKRFNVTAITRDKEYDLTKGSEKSKVHYFTANSNGEAEVVRILLSPNCSAKKKELDFDFSGLEIKGRGSNGNQVVKYPIRSIKLKEKGKSTLEGRKIWFDDKFGRLNSEEKGNLLGTFDDENILVIYKDGNYEIVDTELSQRFDVDKIQLIEKYDPEAVITAVYLDNDKKQFNVKRFKIETNTMKSKFSFIKDGEGNYVEAVTLDEEPVLQVQIGKGTSQRTTKFRIANLVEVMGWKAVGAKLMDFSKTVAMEWIKAKKATSTGEDQPSLF